MSHVLKIWLFLELLLPLQIADVSNFYLIGLVEELQLENPAVGPNVVNPETKRHEMLENQRMMHHLLISQKVKAKKADLRILL